MSNSYFIFRQGQRQGPFTWEQVWRLARRGSIQPADQVWMPTYGKWTRIAEVKELAAVIPVGQPVTGTGTSRTAAGTTATTVRTQQQRDTGPATRPSVTPPPSTVGPAATPARIQQQHASGPTVGSTARPVQTQPQRTASPAATPVRSQSAAGPAATPTDARQNPAARNVPQGETRPPVAKKCKRTCLVVAAGFLIIITLVVLAALVIWLKPADSSPEFANEDVNNFETFPVVSGETTTAGSGSVLIGAAGVQAAALPDGTRLSFPDLGPETSIRLTLERRSNDVRPDLAGLETTGGMRLVNLEDARLSPDDPDGVGLMPFITIPAVEIGQVDRRTVQIARVGDVVIDGELFSNRLLLLPVVADSDGNLVARDVWLPCSPWFKNRSVQNGLQERNAMTPTIQANSAVRYSKASLFPSDVLAGTIATGTTLGVGRSGPNIIRYVAITFHQHINWVRLPNLVRMVPDKKLVEKRKPMSRLSKALQEKERKKPVQNVFVLVHGRNEAEKAGIGVPPEISYPWWYGYKRDVWTHFYATFLKNREDLADCTVFYEFIYPTFRPIFQGRGHLSDFFQKQVREQLKAELDNDLKFNLFIVAHSMGGVVSRAGVQYFDKKLDECLQHLATWGTPHHGSPLVTLNYALISPYYKLGTARRKLSREWRDYLVKSFLVTDTPGTVDLRWTNGTPSHKSELTLDVRFFHYDWPVILKDFKTKALADPVVNLRHGSVLYNENLRRLNANDRYARSSKYIFFYGIAAERVDVDTSAGKWDIAFQVDALRRLSEIGQGATMNWLLVDNHTTKYRGVAQGRSDGAVPILSMTGHDVAGRVVRLGACNHEDYFGAPTSPGSFTTSGLANATAKKTLEGLGFGRKKEYEAPTIKLRLEHHGSIKRSLKEGSREDIRFSGKFVWPGDRQPKHRLAKDALAICLFEPDETGKRKSLTGLTVKDFTMQPDGEFQFVVNLREMSRAGLDEDRPMVLLAKLQFKDLTELESEELELMDDTNLLGNYKGTWQVLKMDRNYLLNRRLLPGNDRYTKMRNDIIMTRNRNYVHGLERAGLKRENSFFISIGTVAENSGEPELLEGKYIIFVNPGSVSLFPHDYRSYKDRRTGELELTVKKSSFHLKNTIVKQEDGQSVTYVYRMDGTLSGGTLKGNWSVMDNGTEIFNGNYTATGLR